MSSEVEELLVRRIDEVVLKHGKCVSLLQKVLGNIVSHPGDPKFRCLDCHAEPVKRLLLEVQEVMVLLNLLGFYVSSDGAHIQWSGESQDIALLDKALRVLKATCESKEAHGSRRTSISSGEYDGKDVIEFEREALQAMKKKHRFNREHDPETRKILDQIKASHPHGSSSSQETEADRLHSINAPLQKEKVPHEDSLKGEADELSLMRLKHRQFHHHSDPERAEILRKIQEAKKEHSTGHD